VAKLPLFISAGLYHELKVRRTLCAGPAALAIILGSISTIGFIVNLHLLVLTVSVFLCVCIFLAISIRNK
jgi:hypothetical protein